ncbi:MAG TPA: protein kinase, partial [Thermoanaerobaculia bacterium]|nr:protein kinase [Thermoanaerobaculia bacterium]
MAITDPLLLPPDVLLVPVGELSDEVRRQLRCDEGDFAVTRPRARTPSRIIDAQAAELLREFEKPVTLVEAVLRFARARGADPETTLEEAFPFLEKLVAGGFLVNEGAAGADGIEPSLLGGGSTDARNACDGWEVVAPLQVLDDTEIYQVRRNGQVAALKLERPGGPRPGVAALLANEAAILSVLGAERGKIAPRLLEQGEHEGRPYLAIEWCSGVDAESAARELRGSGGASESSDREGLRGLCQAIAAAYSRLHERGVVHGDVHPRNILVDAAGGVRLIDLGLSRQIASAAPATARGGVGFFFEPEFAAAQRAGLPAPPAGFASEQYAVAALLYNLTTGTHYRDFSLEREEMLRQIAEEPPLPFAERGVAPWPALEAVLGRALAKAPEERFPDLKALAAALARAEDPEGVPRGAAARRSPPAQ